jgi:hypothetical protein
MNNKIHGEYATKPRAIKPIFIRAIEYLGQRQIDVRRIETLPNYIRPTVEEKPIQTNQPILMINPKGIK